MSQTTYYDLIRRSLLMDAAANAPPGGLAKEVLGRLADRGAATAIGPD